jgi:hypothetical protein
MPHQSTVSVHQFSTHAVLLGLFDKFSKSCTFIQQSGKNHTKPQTTKVRG